jgi:hypothetical protein
MVQKLLAMHYKPIKLLINWIYVIYIYYIALNQIENKTVKDLRNLKIHTKLNLCIKYYQYHRWK